nr:unnamed protein product [Callosobruchus analis]
MERYNTSGAGTVKFMLEKRKVEVSSKLALSVK